MPTPPFKTLRVPRLHPEAGTLEEAVERQGALFHVDTPCWPDRWPYCPLCGGRIAWTENALHIDFRVFEWGIRAVETVDNGRQWEDSCVEFFAEAPEGDDYFNFEVNPCGKLLCAVGPEREGRIRRAPGDMQRIGRTASFAEAGAEHAEGLFAWRVRLDIPWDLLGVDGHQPPERLRANFYKCGDKTAQPHFLSWNPVCAPKPDFHRPECFGTLTFDAGGAS